MVQTLLKKKKSPRQKGADFQDRIAAWLRARDWVVHNQKPSLVNKVVRLKSGELKRLWIVQHKDIFGADLIAKLGNRTVWIQVTLAHPEQDKRLEAFQFHLSKRKKMIVQDRIPWGPQDEHYLISKTEKGVIRIRLVQPVSGLCWLMAEIRRGLLCPCSEPGAPPWPGF